MKTARLYFALGSVEWDELRRWWDCWGARVQADLSEPRRRDAGAFRRCARWLEEQKQ